MSATSTARRLLVLALILSATVTLPAAPASALGSLEIHGLDELVVAGPSTVTVTARVEPDDRITEATPLRLVLTLDDGAGEPLELAWGDHPVQPDDDGQLILPPLDQLPLTLITHPMLSTPEGLSFALTVTAPDAELRSLQARVMVSNEQRAVVIRRAGADRVATAVAVSQAAFPAGAEDVYLARADDFPDALSAGPVAAAADAPILLTASDRLSVATATEIARLAPSRVTVLGGPAALDATVLDDLAQITTAEIVRLAGPDRFATAAAIATAAFEAPLDVVFVATGSAFADALSGGPAAAVAGGAMLLVERDRLPEATAEALRTLQPRRIVVLGGTAAVSEAVAGQLSSFASELSRIAGGDRFATSAAISRAFFTPDDVERLFVATGEAFPDALTGAPAAARHGGPLLLVAHDHVPDPVGEEVTRLGAGTISVLGGPAAVGEEAIQQLAALSTDVGPQPSRFSDFLSGPSHAFAALAEQPPPLVIDGPTAQAPTVLRPGDRFPVSFSSTAGGSYVVRYRPTGTDTWRDFTNQTAAGDAPPGSYTTRLNAPLEEGVLDLQVSLAASQFSQAPLSVTMPRAVTVALTFPPPLISALVEDLADQSQLVVVRPAGGLAEGTRLDIDLSSAERSGADYPLPGALELLGGTGSAVFEVTRDEVARIVYTAGPADRVDGGPTAHPLLVFRIDGITTEAVHQSHVGEFFRYDILHGVRRVFTIGDGPSLASPTVSDVQAGSDHTFQTVSFALREPLAPYERIDIDLSEAEQTVIDYAGAFAYVQSDGGGHGIADHGPPAPPAGVVFLDVDQDESAVLTFIAGPNGVPTVQPEGPTTQIFVGGIVVAPDFAEMTAEFRRDARAEVATATFTTERRALTDVTASDLEPSTAGQSQTLAFTVEGGFPSGSGAYIELPPSDVQLDYLAADVQVVAGEGTARLESFGQQAYVVYDSAGDADAALVELMLTGIGTGAADSSHVMRLYRFDASGVATAVFSVGAGNPLAGATVSHLPDATADVSQAVTFITTEPLAPGATVAVDLSGAEQGLVDYGNAFAEAYDFGVDEPGSAELAVVEDVTASLIYHAGAAGVPAGTWVEMYLYGVATGPGTATYPVSFTLGDGRTTTTSFTVAPPAGFGRIAITDLASGTFGQIQTITADLVGALAPGKGMYIDLSGAELGGVRYGGADAVVTSGGGTVSLYVYSGGYAELGYVAGPDGVPDGGTVTIELRGVNTDPVHETHAMSVYRWDSGGTATGLFDIGDGSDFVGRPYSSDLQAGTSGQYQGFAFALARPLVEGESVVFDLTGAQQNGVDYQSAAVAYTSEHGTFELDVSAGQLTWTAGPEGLPAGVSVFADLSGVTAPAQPTTVTVPVTAGLSTTSVTFEVFLGHG